MKGANPHAIANIGPDVLCMARARGVQAAFWGSVKGSGFCLITSGPQLTRPHADDRGDVCPDGVAHARARAAVFPGALSRSRDARSSHPLGDGARRRAALAVSALEFRQPSPSAACSRPAARPRGHKQQSLRRRRTPTPRRRRRDGRQPHRQPSQALTGSPHRQPSQPWRLSNGARPPHSVSRP